MSAKNYSSLGFYSKDEEDIIKLEQIFKGIKISLVAKVYQLRVMVSLSAKEKEITAMKRDIWILERTMNNVAERVTCLQRYEREGFRALHECHGGSEKEIVYH